MLLGLPGGDAEQATLTGGLEIADNLLVCAMLGVAFEGQVGHLHRSTQR